jgi:hypothetical protein
MGVPFSCIQIKEIEMTGNFIGDVILAAVLVGAALYIIFHAGKQWVWDDMQRALTRKETLNLYGERVVVVRECDYTYVERKANAFDDAVHANMISRRNDNVRAIHG